MDWIDELERRAKAATPWTIDDYEAASEAWKANKHNNAEFCRAANPDVVLRLIRIARAADAIISGTVAFYPTIYGEDDTVMANETEKRLKELMEALG